MRELRTQLAVVTLAVALAGCANTKDFRTLAGLTAQKVASHQRQVDDFTASQNDLDAAAAVELENLSHAAGASVTQTGRMLDRWKLVGDKTRLGRHDVVAAVGPQAILDSLAVVETKPTALADDTADKQLAAAAKAYQALAVKPGFKAQVGEVFEIGQEVGKAVSDARTAANAAAAAAAAAGTASSQKNVPADAKPKTTNPPA
jgi:hypothetical protein